MYRNYSHLQQTTQNKKNKYRTIKNLFLRESVAYPVLITAATPNPPTLRISTGGRAQMGGFKGCSKNFRV